MFSSHFSDGTSKSKEQSQSKKETLKSEDSSFDDVLQAISKLRSGKIIKEKILIAEQSKQTTVHIDVEELKEIGKEIERLFKTLTELNQIFNPNSEIIS